MRVCLCLTLLCNPLCYVSAVESAVKKLIKCNDQHALWSKLPSACIINSHKRLEKVSIPMVIVKVSRLGLKLHLRKTQNNKKVTCSFVDEKTKGLLTVMERARFTQPRKRYMYRTRKRHPSKRVIYVGYISEIHMLKMGY